MAIFTINMANLEMGFSIRHMRISKVKGTFSSYTAKIEAPTMLDLNTGIIEIEIDVASISTMNLARDQHLISTDFFDTGRFPKIYFKKTNLMAGEDGLYKLTGDLTIKNVTKSVVFDTLYNGKKRAYGGIETHSFTCATVINQEAFGLTYNALIEASGTIIDENIQIITSIELSDYD